MAQLPEDANRFVDAIAALAKKNKGDDLLSILDLAEPEFVSTSEDWGISYYRLDLILPWAAFASIADVDSAEKRLSGLSSRASKHCSDAHVTQVQISPAFDAPSDWRTGVRLAAVPTTESDRIWRPGWFRLFLSHESAIKIETAKLKRALAKRNVDAFVAHDDIEPSRAWQEEIGLALGSCQAVAALVTPGFNNSVWCMQEVGWALGRGILVQPIKLPTDPPGFLNATQALPGRLRDVEAVREPLINILAANSRTARHMHEPLVLSLERASDVKQVPIITESLERTHALSEDHARRILAATTQNAHVKTSKEAVKRLEILVERYGVKAGKAEAPNADEYDPFADE